MHVSCYNSVIVHDAIVLIQGETSRQDFAQIGELRSLSILPAGVNIIALMATASNSLRKQVMRTLGMKNASTISVSPNKVNIKYTVVKFKTLGFAPAA